MLLGAEGRDLEPWRASPRQIQLSAPGVGEEGQGGLKASVCLGQQEWWRLKGSTRVTVTPVTFFVSVAEAASLLPLEISVPVQSCLLGGSGMAPP